MAEKEEKLKNPSGLKIDRKGYSFVLTWKQGNNYTHQQIRTRVRYTKTNSKTGNSEVGLLEDTFNINENRKSYVLEINKKDYRPYGARRLEGIEIEVRGKFKNKWSDWKGKSITIHAPMSKPSMSFQLLQKNKGKFSWSVGKGTETYPIEGIEKQTLRVFDCPANIKGLAKWKTASTVYSSSESGSQTIEENSGQISGKSATRIVRTRAVGMGGSSGWSYKKHVYATPWAAQDVSGKVEVNEVRNTMNCTMKWKTPENAAHPIDEIVPQYLIETPEAGMTCPESDSWVSRPAMSSTSGREKDVFSINGQIGVDKCFFVRVLTKHDGDNEIAYSLPKRATGDAYGKLKAPTAPTVTLGTNAVTIESENQSDVPDSKLYMYYEDKKNVRHALGEQVIGNQYPIPNLADKLPIRVCVRAKVVKNKSNLMVSDFVYTQGTVPVAPTSLSLEQSEVVPNTVIASWTWNWDDADACEVSWSTHPDAWDSTDEPESYTVIKARNNLLNISDVEAGVPLYVRARFIKGTEDNALTSPYSDVKSITISSVPAIPELQINKEYFVANEQIECSWVYVTTDGTEQDKAIIAEDLGNDTYQTLATVDEEQSVTIDNNWATGTQHKIAVSVCSKSGRWSQYSESQTVTIAEPVTCSITQNSLEKTTEYNGTSVTIDGGSGGKEFAELVLNVGSVTGTSQVGSSALNDTAIDNASITIGGTTYTAEWDTPFIAGTVDFLNGYASAIVDADGEEVTEANVEEFTPIIPTIASGTQTMTSSDGTIHAIVSVDRYETDGILTELPLTVTVTGAGTSGMTTLKIIRTKDYRIERPDGNDFLGYQDEEIYARDYQGEAQQTISIADIRNANGRLDDGASYKIYAMVRDDFGQSAEDEVLFDVIWNKQAHKPVGVVTIDGSIAKITLTKPTGGYDTDYVDIYRLSTDTPQLIYTGAKFYDPEDAKGTTYVDPYPTIGKNGGYLLVLNTEYGDSITADNMLAWTYYEALFNSIKDIIDFNGEQIQLYYNVDVNHTWSKDLKVTKYLGGSIIGDYKKGVQRAGTMSTVAITQLDKDMIPAMRRLFKYTGNAHIRTRDGSSFTADIQGSEDNPHDKCGEVVSYSMNVTAVEPTTLDGMTLEHWEGLQNAVE